MTDELTPDPMEQAAGAAVVAGDMPADDRHVVWLGQAKAVRDQAVAEAVEDFLARVSTGLGVPCSPEGTASLRLQEMLNQHLREVRDDQIQAERDAEARAFLDGQEAERGRAW